MGERGPLSKKDRRSVEPSIPEQPDDLTPAEAAEWIALVEQLAKAGTGRAAAAHAMRRVVELRVQWRHLQDRIRRDGAIVKDADGNERIAPAAVLAGRIGPAILKLEREFGLTPSSLERFSVTLDADDDPFEQYRRHA